uniref:RNA-dependent RNA polymerase n=1 Tax=Exserohilum turcicum polymycovirus 1 TaxID=3229045 RepID=A0AAU7YEF7_9VIRU
MMATTSEPSPSMYGEPIVASIHPSPLPSNHVLGANLMDTVNYAVSKCLRAGLSRGVHTFRIAMPNSVVSERITIRDVPAEREPYVAVPHARASAFRLRGINDKERLQALRSSDQPRPARAGRRTAFYRDSHRLDALVEKSSQLERPSVKISQYQLPVPFSFGGGPPPEDRPLRAPVLGAIDTFSPRVRDPNYKRALENAVKLANYTSHDPDTLHPRFLNYVTERITSLDPRTRASFDAASSVLRAHWTAHGVHATPLDLSAAAPDKLPELIKHGSPGEYRACGVTDRKDPRLVEVMSKSLIRYGRAGRLVAAGKRAPAWVATTTQLGLTFGKDEPKSGKWNEAGGIDDPVPRFIFNLSPINYALCAFLHSSISRELQEKDPMHGPGYGPGRGRSGKFLSVVEKAFGNGFTVPEGEEMVMSDIDKWDANMREVLLAGSADTLEAHVDKSKLDPVAAATRATMYSVCRRQLLEKLVEHPSGYLLHVYGTMPSGSYRTSLDNTNANNMLLIGHLIDRLVDECGYTAPGAAEDVLRALPGRLVSYGDNQLFSAVIFKQFGLRYDAGKHAEYLARFGMRLKVSETEVTRQLGRVRFCSRAVVRTPHGLLITRPHTSFVAKMAARPEHDPLTDKLYVRAIMADHMGTDPITFEMLSQIDRQIDVPIDLTTVTPRVKPVLGAVALTMFGSDDEASMLAVLAGLSSQRIERRALLSLHTPRGTGTNRSMKVGSTIAPTEFFGGPLTDAAEWALNQTVDTWVDYMRATGQEGVFVE